MNEDSEQVAAAPGHLSPGDTIAGYRIEERIGQGGMAVVFRAYDERLNRTVALKILAPGLAADEAFRQRFTRESRAAAAVDDPHIIPVFEAGEANGALFIAMRYVPGGDVLAIADASGIIPAGRAADIIVQTASALDAAHARGLVHRDVKPANMLVDASGGADGRPDHVYLSDFGLSKWSPQTTGLTSTGSYLGTVDYSAPEQIEARPVDGRADQYSLACAAFQMLTGTAPFHRQDIMAALYAHVSEPPPALTSSRPDLPAAADAVFARALAKDPAERYRTCGDFARALRLALGLAQGASTPGPYDHTAGHPPTQAAGGSVPRQRIPSGVSTQVPVPRQVPGFGAQPAEPERPAGALAAGRRDRHRPGVALLIGASIVLAAGIVAAAIILRSPAQGTPTSGGLVSPPSTQRGSQGAGSQSPAGSASPAPSQIQPSGGESGSPGPAGTGQARYQLAGSLSPGTPGSISSVTWNSAGTLVATSDQNGSTYVWDAATARLAGRPLSGHGKTFAAAFRPGSTQLATAYSTGVSYIWDYQTGQVLSKLTDPGSSAGKEVDSISFSPDGKTLVTSDGNGYANLWRVPASGRGVTLITSLSDPGGAGVYSATFSSQGLLATGDYDGNVYIWNLSGDTPSASFVLPGGTCPTTICAAVSALAFSRDGSLLAAGNESGYARMWSTSGGAGGSIAGPAAAAGQSIWAFSFSRTGMLAMADADGQSYLYRVTGDRATLEGTLRDPRSGAQGVGALRFSPSGRYLVTGDTNGSAYLWRHG